MRARREGWRGGRVSRVVGLSCGRTGKGAGWAKGEEADVVVCSLPSTDRDDAQSEKLLGGCYRRLSYNQYTVTHWAFTCVIVLLGSRLQFASADLKIPL